jgi:hypothetical protein
MKVDLEDEVPNGKEGSGDIAVKRQQGISMFLRP